MTIFIGIFETAGRHLPILEQLCDQYGGSILVTEKGISYGAPAREERETLELVHSVLGPVSCEIHPELLQQAA